MDVYTIFSLVLLVSSGDRGARCCAHARAHQCTPRVELRRVKTQRAPAQLGRSWRTAPRACAAVSIQSPCASDRPARRRGLSVRR